MENTEDDVLFNEGEDVMPLLYALSVVKLLIFIVNVFWCGAQGQGPTNKKNLVSWGIYFLNFVCLGDLIDCRNLTTGN